MAQPVTLDEAVAIFVDGFAHLQSFVGQVDRGERDGIRFLSFHAGRRATRFKHEFFALDADPAAVIALAREIAGDVPHMIDLLGPAQDERMPAYEAAGYAGWGRETLMALDLVGLAPDQSGVDVRPIEDAATAERIVRAQAEAGLRPHPMTAAHIADAGSLHRWVAVEGEVAAFARVALVHDAAYLSDVVTLPAFRRRGLANALVRALLLDARAAGARDCVLSATEMAHGLYRSLGFVDITPLIGFNTR